MEIKLFDSELKVMEVLWNRGPTTAKQIAELLSEQVGWSKTTTYTVIKKCIEKGVIQRRDPHFVCHPLVPREKVQESEARELVNKMFDGSVDQLITALLGGQNLSPQEIVRLKKLVESLEKGN